MDVDVEQVAVEIDEVEVDLWCWVHLGIIDMYDLDRVYPEHTDQKWLCRNQKQIDQNIKTLLKDRICIKTFSFKNITFKGKNAGESNIQKAK